MLFAHIAALALATTAFVASGCGSSSSTTTTTTTAASTPATTASTTTPPVATVPAPPTIALASGTPLTRAQLITKGEAICTRLNAQLGASTAKSLAELARALPVAAAEEKAEFVQLVKLVPPATMASAWREFLAETKQWSEDSEKLAISTQTQQLSLTAPLVQSTRAIHEHLAHVAERAGFKECALI